MRRLIVSIGSIVIIALIVYAIRQIDLSALISVLSNSRYDLWLLAFLLTLASLYPRAKRWQVLLDGKISFKRCFHVNNIAYMLNMIVPFRLGEISRIVMMSRGQESVPMTYTLAGIILERLIDILILLFLLAISLLFLPVQEYVSLISFAVGLLAIAGVIVLILLANAPARIFAILAWFEKHVPLISAFHPREKLENFRQGVNVLRSWRQVAQIAIWSFAAWALTFLTGYVLLIAFFGEASWQSVLFFNSFASVAVVTTNTLSYVPVAAGPYQASIVISLQIIGITEPEGAPLAFAIVLHLVNFFGLVLSGIAGMFREGLSIMELLRLNKLPDSDDAATEPSA